MSAWQTNDGELLVEFNCSTGGNDVLCQVETIVIDQSESQSQSIILTLVDDVYDWHPEGVGPHKDVMVGGAELELSVTWGGVTTQFFATMKPASVGWGPDANPTLTWTGYCEGDRLFASKRTLETLLPDPDSPAILNKTVMTEVCTALDVLSDWTGVLTMRIGTPYHRQQLTPGQVVHDMLNLSVDEWRTDYKTVTGYDPEEGGTRWEYDIDAGDQVFSQSISAVDVDPIDQVVVLRAIATGQLLPADEGTELRLFEFGDGQTVSFDPPVTMVTWEMVARDFRARVSDLKFYTDAEITATRDTTNPFDTTPELERARIWNCTSVSFTWGASNPDVDPDLTEANGVIRFFGRPNPTTTVGEEGVDDDFNGPLDPTTRVLYPPGEELDNQLELPANPLLYGPAEMEIHGERVFRRAARQQREFSYRVPLNPAMVLGDTLAVKKDVKLGGSGFIEFIITGLTHSISGIPENRFTQVTGVEYVDA